MKYLEVPLEPEIKGIVTAEYDKLLSDEVNFNITILNEYRK